VTAPATSYLVCYDISGSTRRLARTRRLLLASATPLQYSVFLGRFTHAGRRDILSALARSIDPRVDDVRLYPVPERPAVLLLGRRHLPEGIFLRLPGLAPPPASR
jgi:CRISPR-associated protein Cas2